MKCLILKNGIFAANKVIPVRLKVVEKVVGGKTGEDDRNRRGKDLENVVSVFDYHCDAETTERLKGNDNDHAQVIATEESVLHHDSTVRQKDTNEGQDRAPKTCQDNYDMKAAANFTDLI